MFSWLTGSVFQKNTKLRFDKREAETLGPEFQPRQHAPAWHRRSGVDARNRSPISAASPSSNRPTPSCRSRLSRSCICSPTTGSNGMKYGPSIRWCLRATSTPRISMQSWSAKRPSGGSRRHSYGNDASVERARVSQCIYRGLRRGNRSESHGCASATVWLLHRRSGQRSCARDTLMTETGRALDPATNGASGAPLYPHRPKGFRAPGPSTNPPRIGCAPTSSPLDRNRMGSCRSPRCRC